MATVIKNADRLLKRLNNIANVDLKQTMNEATALVQGSAKNLVPVDTGYLRSSIHMETKGNQDSLEGRVYTNTNYAPFVEFGTGSKGNGTYPYDLKERNLSYRETPWVFTPDDGKHFYTSHGQVAQPFMYPALEQNKKTIRKMFKDAAKANIESQCRGG